MNNTKRVDVQTCMLDLQEALLDVLAEAKQAGKCIGVAEIAKISGIREQFVSEEAGKWINPFTRTLLLELKDAGRIQNCQKQGKGAGWELTAEEFNRRRM